MAGAEVDYYAVLGVGADASTEEVTRAFRRQVRRWHPDTRGQHEPDTSEEDADARLDAVFAAYAVLCHPDHRAAYDQASRRRNPGTRSSPRGPRPPSGPEAGRQPPLRAGPVRYHPSR